MARGRTAGNRGQGSNWCSKEKRAIIAARDNHECVWCRASLRLGGATIDHIEARSRGGDNALTNLILACMRCNRLRGNRGWLEFAVWTAAQIGCAPSVIIARILRAQERSS